MKISSFHPNFSNFKNIKKMFKSFILSTFIAASVAQQRNSEF